MKKTTKKSIICLIISMALIFSILHVSVFALEISQESLTVSDKSSTITVNNEGIGDLEVSPDVEFNEVGDYITYKLVLKNTDGKKFKVISVTDDNENEYIKTSYKTDNELNTDDKEIFITLKYEKEFSGDNFNINPIKATIKLIDEDEKEQEVVINNNPQATENGSNPKTGDNIGRTLTLFIISGLSIIIIYNKNFKAKKCGKGKHIKGLFIVLFAISIIPAMSFAIDSKDIIFNINVQKIKINGYHTVTFNTDGEDKNEIQIVKHNEEVSKPTDPTKTGHTFIKWLDEEESEFDFSTKITEDRILTAVWEKNTYTITLNPNGGTLPTDTLVVEYGDEIGNLPIPTPPVGMKFDGWYKGNEKIEDGYVVTGEETLVARYTTNDYTITYNLDGGTVNGTNPETYTVETDEFTLINPEKEGHHFKGWTGSNGTTPEQTVTITKGSTGNKEFTAVFEKKEYTVSFITNGGTDVAEKIVKYNETITRPEDPTKTGYIFIKWLDEDGNEYNFDTPVINDITLTAKWKVAKATIVTTEQNNDNTLNLKMKQIANPGVTITSGYDYADMTTRAFKKATEDQYNAIKDSLTDENIVSAPDSLAPVYMWFDDSTGTMYWYTEAEKVAFEGTMGRLFAKYTKLTDISGFAEFDTSGVTDMNRLIQNCSSLTDISPLRNWDVSNVKSFQFAFGAGKDGDAPPIEDFSPISGWNVGNVENFNQMFKYNRQLTDLNAFENWDMSSATNISNMFTGTANLTNAYAIKEWNVVNVNNFKNVFSTGKDGNSPNASSGILPYYNDPTKLPPFTKKTGTWSDRGNYTPAS